MSMKHRLLTAACAVAVTSCAVAQQSTLAKVVFQNAGPYRQADLETAAGVHAEQRMSLADMQAAAQKLVDTGCFDNVSLDSKGTSAALTLIFQLKPSGAGDIHRIGFTNFVWLTPGELDETVRKVAPLVNSGLPEGGAILDSISAALQAALASKGVPNADVGHDLVLPTSAEPTSAINYHVNRPAVLVNAITLDGVSGEFAPQVQKVVAQLQGKPFVEGPSNRVQRAVLRPYLNAGFLDATIDGLQRKVVPKSTDVYGVDLNGVVDSGSQYHVAAIRYEGTAVFTSEAFAAASKLHAGDVASRAEFLETVAPIDAAYHRLGYVDEYVMDNAQRDAAAHTVTYTLKVVPGEVYRLHSVTVQGLSPEARTEFDQAWAMKVGDAYDPDYVRAFIKSNSAKQKLGRYAGAFGAAADPATHMVDLTLTFAPGTAR